MLFLSSCDHPESEPNEPTLISEDSIKPKIIFNFKVSKTVPLTVCCDAEHIKSTLVLLVNLL
jgi:hypothetical protein